jgi:small subunit ribosomal protein S8
MERSAMMTDPIGDMLARIRNAGRARHRSMSCPASRLKVAVASALSKEGFLGEVSTQAGDSYPVMTVGIRYADDGSTMMDGIRRVSKPGRRVYVGADEIPRIRKGLGAVILSTPKGVMCDRDAREAKVGGEVICEVW